MQPDKYVQSADTDLHRVNTHPVRVVVHAIYICDVQVL